MQMARLMYLGLIGKDGYSAFFFPLKLSAVLR